MYRDTGAMQTGHQARWQLIGRAGCCWLLLMISLWLVLALLELLVIIM